MAKTAIKTVWFEFHLCILIAQVLRPSFYKTNADSGQLFLSDKVKQKNSCGQLNRLTSGKISISLSLSLSLSLVFTTMIVEHNTKFQSTHS
jgi:hypothetical protein